MDQIFNLDMQKDTIVHSIHSVMLDLLTATLLWVKHHGCDGERRKSGPGRYLDIGLLDTMKDLFVNFIGAVVFSVIGYSMKNREKGRFCQKIHPA